MSENKMHSNKDFSKFDSMSTETLREILYQDSLLPEREGYDMDAILYIMEVMTKREAEHPTEEFTPVDEAWQIFNEYYRSEDSDGTSLYETPDEDVSPILPFPTKEHSKPKKNLRTLLRVGCTAAALLLVLFGGTLTSYAMGFDLWGTVAQWTKDTFGFSVNSPLLSEDSIYPGDNDPREMLKNHKITAPLLPNWLPDGYEFSDIIVFESPVKKKFDVIYSNSETEILMSITLLSGVTTHTYEKDEGDVVVYIANEIEHYILCNNEMVQAVWAVGNYECCIVGNITSDDVQSMIDSIYWS